MKTSTDTMLIISDVREIIFKEVDPDSFLILSPNNDGHIFGIIMRDSRVCYLRCPNKSEMANWMLTIDGLKAYQSATAMTNIAKVNFI